MNQRYLSNMARSVAVIALLGASAVYAQGTPPNPASPNAATGVGQTDSQGTPKGETGTPYGGGTGARMSPSAGSAPMTSAPMAAPAPMRSRPARADRN